MAVAGSCIAARPLGVCCPVNIQDLGSIGELVAAIATIGTLIYLAIQIRHNTMLARTQYVSSSAERLQPYQFWRADSLEKARLYRIGTMQFDAISPDERMMLDGLLHAQLMQFADAHSAYEKGFLDGEVYEGYKFYVASLVGMPGCSKWWSEAKVFYASTGLDALIDAEIAITTPYHELAPSLWRDLSPEEQQNQINANREQSESGV